MSDDRKLRSFGLTDVGSVRGNNEDAIHFDDERGIYFVVDGMGGHAAGEQAARIAAERLQGRLERATGTPERRIREAITLANEAIVEAGEQNPEWRGMACVLTVAVVENGSATVGHVGDSRLYTLREGTLTKRTPDHSPVGVLEDSGQLSEQEAMRHPRRNEVYRDVGSEHRDADDPGFIDIVKVEFEPDSALLLCSDGLSDALPSAEIVRVIQENAGDRVAAVGALIEEAKQTGKDNISAILVEGPAFVAASPGVKKRKAAPKKKTMAAVEARPVGETLAAETTSTPVAVAAPAREVVRVPFRESSPLWVKAMLVLLGFAAGIGVAALGYYLWRQQPTVTQAPAPTGPRHLLVPGTFPTIAEAMESARAGDTVDLTPSEFHEAIRLKSGVTLRGGDAVLIAPAAGDRGFAVSADRTEKAAVQNLKIAGAGWLGGIAVTDGELVVHDVDVQATSGAGLEVSGGSKVRVEASAFHDNAGPGILLKDGSSGSVLNNKVYGNGRSGESKFPGLRIASPGPWSVEGNRIQNNGSDAIWNVQAMPKPEMERNFFGPDLHKGRMKDQRLIVPATVVPGGSL